MLLQEINIRDPFILPDNETYYLFGTRAKTCWGKADGFDGYKSKDLVNWDGPYEVFNRPEGFWADKNYWAPEVHKYNGSFYMFATFNSESLDKKGTMILKADTPLGPYRLHSDGKITPDEWNCLDGTFYVSGSGKPYMVFSHEWVDIGDGEICYVELSIDLKTAVSAPKTLFSASEAKPWVSSITHRSRNEPVYVTDGPFMYRTNNGELIMLWATFSDGNYAEGIARSDNGEIDGNWSIDKVPLFDKDGGHGMLFRTFEGNLNLVLHQPNETPLEHPVLIPIDEKRLKA
ncbi:glycoside hydrolase family 43 protein [Butyrivibrio sp. INlla21]|uniref:glycoside hydrolase family 43 protein n=1 Tax=Butyrivibrio sp. INlla21 TaxID=1520811 RepID=UPI0008EC3E5F|nr:glycoside hydrolase family 43 protein [Butyrivibrio sp. INlla21]SFU52173.1 Beta-xylosidase, GH43 family [Butyrivibrio sp. INlla21]